MLPAARESRWYLYKPNRVPSTNSGVKGAGSGAGAALQVDNIRARPSRANKVCGESNVNSYNLKYQCQHVECSP